MAQETCQVSWALFLVVGSGWAVVVGGGGGDVATLSAVLVVTWPLMWS